MKAFSDWKDLFNLRMKTFDIKMMRLRKKKTKLSKTTIKDEREGKKDGLQ